MEETERRLREEAEKQKQQQLQNSVGFGLIKKPAASKKTGTVKASASSGSAPNLNVFADGSDDELEPQRKLVSDTPSTAQIPVFLTLLRARCRLSTVARSRRPLLV